jgi:arylsulfatase A-like enzyme
LRVVAPDAFPSQIRDRVRWNLTPGNWLPGLVGDAAPDRPFFLFVHVPSPHAPFVFERDGEATLDPEIEFIDQTPFSNRTPEDVAEVTQAYADQLAYIDDLTISALDQVLSSVPGDSVVIVMSDHGPDAHVDWDHLSTTDTHERFANFFAARTPGAPNLFGDAPTPVNVFQTLLNHYLGSNLPTQSDSSFLGVPPRDEILDIGDPDAD